MLQNGWPRSTVCTVMQSVSTRSLMVWPARSGAVSRHSVARFGKFDSRRWPSKGRQEFKRCDMDILDSEPGVSSDGREIAFRLSARMGGAGCAITREALEHHFWLSPDADVNRMLKTFAEGQKRIVAIAERKVLVRPGQPVRLTSSDFAKR